MRAGRFVAAVATFALLASCSVGPSRAEEAMCDGLGRAGRILAAQAVPSATLVPCVRVYPPGWRYGGSEVRDGIARFWLDSDRAGIHAVEVTLLHRCTTEGRNVTASSGELDVRVFLQPISLSPYAADRHFLFEGGCVTYRYRFADAPQAPLLAAEADDALTFIRRAELVELAESEAGLTLCGAEAPPCIGEE